MKRREKHGENMQERRRVAVIIFYSGGVVGAKIFTVQTGEEKVRKNEEKTLNTLLCDCGAAINCGASFNYLIQ